MRSVKDALMGLLLIGALTVLPSCKEKQPKFHEAQGRTSAERAVNAARRFSGITLNLGWEDGAQALDPLRYSGPRWEMLTGIKLNVVELGGPKDQYRRLVAEHEAKTAALDCASIAPAWLDDLVRIGALENLEPYIQHYVVQDDLDDVPPFYREMGVYEGKRYGLFDDGDIMLLYYRKDLFSDPSIKKEFQRKYGRPLGDPRHYDTKTLLDVARFFTEKFAPNLYGMAPFTPDIAWAWFQALLRIQGGRFFDPETMKARINDPSAVLAMNLIVDLGRTMPPGSSFLAETRPGETTFGSYLSGKAAMASFWPPLGRWAEEYEPTRQSFGMLAGTQVRGKTGYALLPGEETEMAVGFLLTVQTRSLHKEAAYLFIQWLNSAEVSLERVTLPYALRDPFRFSHFQSEKYRGLWPTAPEYLAILQEAATNRAWMDLAIPGANDYAEAFFEALGRTSRGASVTEALDRMASDWDKITRRLGSESQREAYAEFLKHEHAGR